MAPIEATIALSHVEGVSDSARARELYKYYQPNAPIKPDVCFPPSSPPLSGSLEAYQEEEELPQQQPEEEQEEQELDPTDLNIQSNVISSKISSPDTALTAFCQLTSWRIGAQRAMISVIDAETQYFIAESTKTVDLVDNTKHAPGDEIWLGCSTVTKAGRLCERTIAVAPTHPGDYPAFVVNDLRLDERFNQLPFVTGSPFLKFYAGVPLITKRGIPIGSLFVVDDRVRPGLSRDDTNFMGTMAKTIMRHMEMVREVEEHRRGMKMSRGLASFVEGRAELVEAEVEAEDGEGTKIAGQFEAEPNVRRAKSKGSVRESQRGSVASAITSVSSIERKEKEYSAALSKTEQAIMDPHDVSESQDTRPDLTTASQPASFGGTSVNATSPVEYQDKIGAAADEEMSEATSMKMVFSRAANLIREAFEVDGGAVFYDAQRSFSADNRRQSTGASSLFPQDSAPESHTSGDDLGSSSDLNPDRGADLESRSPRPTQSPHSPLSGEGLFSRSSAESRSRVEVLGFSTAGASSIHGDALPGSQSFTPLEEKSLETLLRPYPRGKLWNFDSDGAISSSSEEDFFKPYSGRDSQRSRDPRQRNVRRARAKADAKFLYRHFPEVRQLLFVPLWDAGRSGWLSAVFAWSTEPTRILSKQNELAFLSAFGNSVMAECSRIDTEIADQKKGDFIGSISHELRSPLHGILASAEFLDEAVTDPFQRGMVETIDSCGRTLLDTINHILDFSKINHFEKNWRKSKRSGSKSTRSGALAMRQADLPMINLFAEVDISVACEEVVEGVFAGHVFQNMTAQSFDMVPHSQEKMSDPRRFSTTEHMMGPEKLQNAEVAVILDVDVKDYHFTTQPGAFRRVIMNLLGNALKYTAHGYVRIKLDSTPMDDLHTSGTSEVVARSLVTITITDTGRGISSEFLRGKLFTPFAQENSLSSGTGLGLSIVRSIVSLLEGEITFDSELGRGTEVRVTLPLLREMPKTADSSSTPKSSTSLPRESDETINSLRARVMGRKASLHGFDLATRDPVVNKMGQLLKASITNFLTNWYGLQIVPLGQRANIIISNEADPHTVTTLARRAASPSRVNPLILVLCKHSAKFDRNVSPSDSKCKIGFISKPVGPLKLAKAITACFEGAPPLSTPGFLDSSSAAQVENNDLTTVFEDLSLSPNGGELLDNSRMAADSENARKAIESPTPNASTEKDAEFPFPISDRPPVPTSHSMPADKETLQTLTGVEIPNASVVLSSMEKASHNPSPSSSESKRVLPTLLLVDDNKINLKLLGTFMTRKGYEVIDTAEDGLEAVNKVQEREQGYDIIFMDISMPILDGFGATRQIRKIEENRRKKAARSSLPGAAAEDELVESQQQSASGAAEVGTRTPALVIALTGLASNRDQAEAAACGIDLFLTKPVAFKEVGRLLENWEGNQEKESKGSGA